MKASASLVSVLVHAAALVGLGLRDPGDASPSPAGDLELRSVELIELPEPESEPPKPEPEPAPSKPEPAPPKPEPAPPKPEPAPPKPEPAPPKPEPAPSKPEPAPSAEPTPGASAEPFREPSGAPSGSGQPASSGEPRKIGQRYSNAKGGRARGKSGCSERPSRPVPTKKVAPKFPAAVLRSNITGTLTLRAQVDASGSVSKVAVVTSPGASVEAVAVDAFSKWRFEPAMACGKPVASSYAKSWAFKGAG